MTDICLILEGTYPYITGGVSTWVHALISGLPEFGFSLVHLMVRDGRERVPRFDLPLNLREIVTIEIDGYQQLYQVARWQPGPVNLPQARVYHALSTGFAGLLAGQIKEQSGQPFILTEHAIYLREIAEGAMEVECGFRVIQQMEYMEVAAQRRHWTATFRQLARLAYTQADAIVTVCEANRRHQLEEGAKPDKCHVIPNGVSVDKFTTAARRTPFGGYGNPSYSGGPRIGLVGRVVPIKDVKTFIRAAHLLARQLPEAEFAVIGPTDQDAAYYRQCCHLAAELGLGGQFTFTGELSPQECYAGLDAMVLTSRSEGQPLAVLEAMGAGRPVVVTDVGACRELVEGMDKVDQALGLAGFVIPPQDPQATAEAVLALCRAPQMAVQMGRTGQRRVRAFYQQERCLTSYRRLYKQYL
jgi:glycosyltransferase involved in cell wall biosynthesis